MPPKKLFFLHNPKAGGASLKVVLHQICNGSAAPIFGNAPNDARDLPSRLSEYAGFDFYSGHYGYHAYRNLETGHDLVTNFRDPIRRIYSIYRYWRNNIPVDHLKNADPSDASLVMLAKNLSFSEFIRTKSDDLLLYIKNFHFRQLHSCGWKWGHTGPAALWTVKHRIRRMFWFYIAETPESSAFLLRRAFSDAPDIPLENRSLGPEERISPEDAAHLIQLNKLDYAIYAYAVQVQAARLKAAALHR